MDIEIREFQNNDVSDLAEIWNEVVENGNEFPQQETLNETEAAEFFSMQTYTAAAKLNGTVVGLYILHPNNIGRCGHIANASFAVKSGYKGHGIGKKLVQDCLSRASDFGFKILQFNAVVKNNKPAIKLYNSLGFRELGTIPGGFLCKSGKYEDIILFYHLLP